MDFGALSAVIAAVPIPLLLLDAQDRIAAANDGARRLFGSGLEGRLHVTVLRQPVVIEGVETVRTSGREVQARIQITGPTSDLVYRLITAPVGEGRVLLAFEDQTDVEQASRIRRDFVANVSHELRTPLTALLGFIETLQGRARDDAQARDRFLTIMASEAERMNRLVDDLLSLTRVEAEERVRPTALVDLGRLAATAAASLRPLADSAGVRIQIDRDAAIRPIPADEDQIIQVLTNLIENAVKYGGTGGVVTVRLTHLARDAALRGPAVRIDVIDRGEGIDEMHLPRLTERFYRVDSHRGREKGGTGLGLAIVKHIVSRHRGRLKIASTKGEGSTFSVILPAQ